MIDPYTDEALLSISPDDDDDRPARSTLRCDECGRLLAGISQLVDHLERRH